MRVTGTVMSSSMSLTHLYARRISTSTAICCRSHLIVGLALWGAQFYFCKTSGGTANVEPTALQSTFCRAAWAFFFARQLTDHAKICAQNGVLSRNSRFRSRSFSARRVQFYICKNFGGIANRTAFQPRFRRILPSRASPHTARWPKSAPGTAFCHEIADFGLEAP